MRKIPLVLASLAFAAVAHGLDFTATYDPTATPAEKAAMQAAMNEWASKLTNAAHVDVAFVADPTLGNSGNAYFDYDVDIIPYATYKTALAAHASSTLDATAVGYLQATTNDSYGFLVNGTNQNNGAKHLAVDDQIEMLPALEKALGIGVGAHGADPDFTVYYNPDASRYDYNPSDGIEGGKIDFQSIMLAQVGNGLGFINQVELLDEYANAGFNDADANGLHAPLDLFRYESLGGTALRSWTYGPEAKYFSVDGGVTSLGGFHTGSIHGDGYNSATLIESDGVFRRPVVVGQAFDISALDLQAMDAIGWNINPVPEPAALLPLAFGALALLRRRTRRA